MILVPIRVKIKKGVRAGKKCALYPDFNEINASIRGGLDWSVYIDAYGIGWHYDKVDNIGKGLEEEYACTCVPEEFANAALALFPAEVEIIGESVFEDFYDNRSHIYEPTVIEDVTVLQTLAAKVTLGIAQSADDLRALDPDDDMPGRRNNKRKTWASFKTNVKRDLIIDQKYRKQ